METFLQYVFTGLSAGSLYALVALGLVLMYRSSRVLNFAHGEMAVLGTFFAFTLLGKGFSFTFSFIAAIIAVAALSIVFFFAVIVPAQIRGATHSSQIMLTLGLSLILQGLIIHNWGAEPEHFSFPLSDIKIWNIRGVYVNELALGTMATGIFVSLLLYLLIQKTRLGIAMRATSENLMAAQTLGIPTSRVLAASWAVAAGLGVLAGLFLAPALMLDPFFMMDPFLKGFAAAVLGGLYSLPGAVLGAFILGLGESLVGGYLTLEYKNTLAFVLVIVVLLVRPEGLLGKEFKERV